MRLRSWACGLAGVYAAIAVVVPASPVEQFPAVHMLDDAVIATLAVVTAVLLRELGSQAKDPRLRGFGACLVATAIVEFLHLVVGVEWAGGPEWISRSAPFLQSATWQTAAYLLPLSILLLLRVDGARWRDRAHRLGVVAFGVGLMATLQLVSAYVAGPLGIQRALLLPVPVLWLAVVMIAGWRWRWDILARIVAVTAAFTIVGQGMMLWSGAPDDAPSILAHNGKLLAYLFLLGAAMRRARLNARRRLETQQALERMNRRLALSEFSVSAAGVPTCWVGADARFLRVNRAMCELLGYDESELLRMSVPDINESFPAARWPDHWHELRTKRRMRFESEVQGKGGRAVPVEIELNWLEFDGVEYDFAQVHDISERKRAETRVRESEERLQLALRAMNEAVWDWDLVDRRLTVNDLYRTWFGDPPTPDGSTTWWRDRLHPDDAKRVDASLAAAIAGGEDGWQCDYRFRRVDGSWANIHTKAVLAKGGFGRVVRVVGAMADVTEQARAEEARRASDEQFRSALEHSAIGMALVAPDGRLLVANPALARLTGYDEHELLSLTVQEITHPDDLEDDLAQGRRMVAREIETYRLEKRYIRKDGAVIWGLLSVSLVWTDAGEPLYFIAQVQDMTQRRTAEEKILALTAELERRVEERTADLERTTLFLDSIVENLPAMIFVKDAESLRFVRINRAGEQLLGYSRSELLGKSDHDFFPEDQAVSFVAKDREVLSQGAAVEVPEEAITTRERGVRLLHTWKIPIANPHGSPPYLLVISEDITDRRMAEERFRLVVESAPSGIFVADASGVIRLANEQLGRQFGCPRSDLVGRAVGELLPDLVWTDVASEFVTLATATSQAGRGRRSDGTDFPVEVGLSTLRVGAGWHVFGYVTDVTDQKRAEHEIREANAHVTERARELEVAMKELEAFSYSVSHDLRAPLRHIGGYARLLKTECDDRLSDEGRRYLQTITDAVKRSGRLVDDLLAFSRMGRTEMRRGVVKLGMLVDECARATESDTQGRRIEWIRREMPEVVGDGAMLKLALDNLIGNAVKYTRGRDPARIEIGCLPSTADDVVLYVRDNGVGFDMRHAGKLFGVFQRLHDPDEFEGTGIGLANVRRIVERHGGRAWAEARVDEGATFFVALPRDVPARRALAHRAGKGG